MEALIGAGPQQPIDPDAVRAGVRRRPLARAAGAGGLRRGAPRVFVDAAHNPHGARALAATLTAEFRFTRLVGVLGVMREKDARGILAELEPVLAEVVVTANTSPRAMDPDELGAVAVEVFGADRVSVEPTLSAAVEEARRAGRGGRRVRQRRDRHRVGRHGGGSAHAVRPGAGMSTPQDRGFRRLGCACAPQAPKPVILGGGRDG